MLTRLEYKNGKLTEVGLIDGCEISQKRKNMLIGVAKTHINHPTKHEKILLYNINCLRRMCWSKFRYQREKTVHLADNIGRVIDIYFNKQRFAIEIDGKWHNEDLQFQWDKWRDKLLRDNRITVIRVKNHDVAENIDDVMLRVINGLIYGARMGTKAIRKLKYIRKQLDEGIKWKEIINRFNLLTYGSRSDI